MILILKIFVVYDSKGVIKSIGAPGSGAEEGVGLDAPKGCKVLELGLRDVEEIAKFDQNNASKNNLQERQRLLGTIFDSYQVDAKRSGLIRKKLRK